MRYAVKKSGKLKREAMSAIEVDRVSKSFGVVRAVDDVSFKVAGGEVFGLLGPNGAGKTTILRLILDIFKPDEGVYDHVPALRKAAEGIAIALDSQLSTSRAGQSQPENN